MSFMFDGRNQFAPLCFHGTPRIYVAEASRSGRSEAGREMDVVRGMALCVLEGSPVIRLAMNTSV